MLTFNTSKQQLPHTKAPGSAPFGWHCVHFVTVPQNTAVKKWTPPDSSSCSHASHNSGCLTRATALDAADVTVNSMHVRTCMPGMCRHMRLMQPMPPLGPRRIPPRLNKAQKPNWSAHSFGCCGNHKASPHREVQCAGIQVHARQHPLLLLQHITLAYRTCLHVVWTSQPRLHLLLYLKDVKECTGA